jgi:hypothetical protein
MRWNRGPKNLSRIHGPKKDRIPDTDPQHYFFKTIFCGPLLHLDLTQLYPDLIQSGSPAYLSRQSEYLLTDLNIRVGGGLLQLLRVHPVAEGVNNTYLNN